MPLKAVILIGGPQKGKCAGPAGCPVVAVPGRPRCAPQGPGSGRCPSRCPSRCSPWPECPWCSTTSRPAPRYGTRGLGPWSQGRSAIPFLSDPFLRPSPGARHEGDPADGFLPAQRGPQPLSRIGTAGVQGSHQVGRSSLTPRAHTVAQLSPACPSLAAPSQCSGIGQVDGHSLVPPLVPPPFLCLVPCPGWFLLQRCLSSTALSCNSLLLCNACMKPITGWQNYASPILLTPSQPCCQLVPLDACFPKPSLFLAWLVGICRSMQP